MLYRRPRSKVVATAALLLLAAAPAGAADAEGYRLAVDAATSLFKAGAYEDALLGFARAYEASPHPDPLFWMARCHHLRGRLDDAAATYERFLAAAPAHAEAVTARTHLVEVLVALADQARARGDAAAGRALLERALRAEPLPERRAKVEAALAALSPATTVPAPPAASSPALAAPSTPATPSRRMPGLALWIGVGGGAAAVAVIATVLAVVLRPHVALRRADEFSDRLWDIRED